jgi:hypothetical protein
MNVRILLALFITVAACDSGITDASCTAPVSCEVNGVDLVPVAAIVDSASIVEYRGCCIGDIVNPTSINVRVTIANRGDKPSNTLDAEVSAFGAVKRFSMPTIPPGQSLTQAVSLTFTRKFLMAGTDLVAENVKVRVFNNDSHPENNTLAGHRISIDVPYFILEPEITAPQTVRIGQNVTFSSTYEFDLSLADSTRYRTITLLFCLESGSRSCTPGNWQPVTRYDVTSYFGTRVTSAQLTAQALPASPAGEYRILICAVPRGALYVEPNNVVDHCRPGGVVTVTS